MQGDFGESIKWPGRTAMDMAGSRVVATLQLAGSSMILAAIMAVAFGVLTAIRRDTPFDYFGKIFALFGRLPLPSGSASC